MATIKETVEAVVAAQTYDARVAEIRKIPGKHGTDTLPEIYSAIARELYVPHLPPDFAYIHPVEFYDLPHFRTAYTAAADITQGFQKVDASTVAQCLITAPQSLLAFRAILGLTPDELGHATGLIDSENAISKGRLDNMERKGTKPTPERADLLAQTICRIVEGTLFGEPDAEVVVKQQFKADTKHGWASVREFHSQGVNYATFLQQRHYGGAFRQILDATSTKRGNLYEDAVESLFQEHQIPYIRTGAHNQADIAKRFELTIAPAPDFVVFDQGSDTLMAMLECKTANDGGTARDKAMRFNGLKSESSRLGGIPVMAVLGGAGWHRTNDTLGPVLANTDGRVFTLNTLDEMLEVSPISKLRGTATLAED
ncbi:helix-turn-helix transcriptional regulator [Nesterenkonia sp. NBAIMH1]|uniref:helix-turn-helix domain-containing protein n=1 Tax=Nesterenkonia sp. NBAIMH1 TaxID=2600320 RepID=UPI0011B678ED|nr:helix-turn-helix transcriptional regulator [Nesterenkonia sp. NBAIMH1]